MSNAEIKQLENSEVEISGEIPVEDFEKYRARALKKLGENAEIPGFRKGHAPEDVLTQKLGEDAVLHEMAELALSAVYPTLLAEHKIDAIGQPSVAITKLARGNPLGFRIKTAVLPSVALPDYKKIAEKIFSREKEPIVVTDEEVERTLDEVRRNFARVSKVSAGSGSKSPESNRNENEILGPDGQPVKPQEKKEDEKLPELTDEFVKKVGKFENVEDFKNKIRENLREEKKLKEKDRARLEVIDALIEKTGIAVPDVLVASEQARMMAQFKDQLALAGVKPDDYFKHADKSEDDIKKEWRADAVKRVKTQLVIGEIAAKEHLHPAEDDAAREAQKLLDAYPGADAARARAYVEHALTNEMVFEFLEDPSAPAQGDASDTAAPSGA
ncbi:MAG: hypothetical protein HYS74_01395 [Parcubacteria group bacterium]|nr:hypothetical protein [Parcubacteria group bacterium]